VSDLPENLPRADLCGYRPRGQHRQACEHAEPGHAPHTTSSQPFADERKGVLKANQDFCHRLSSVVHLLECTGPCAYRVMSGVIAPPTARLNVGTSCSINRL